MRRLRWAADGEGQWELDISTPATLDGEARAVPGDPLPLGVTRGPKLSRYKQTDFFHRFMGLPALPSSSSHSSGFSLLRAISVPLTRNWLVSLLSQFHVQKILSAICEDDWISATSESLLQRKARKLIHDKSLYSLGISSEMFLSPYDTLLASFDTGGRDSSKPHRKRVVLRHEFPHHDLTMEAASPALFMDKSGNYWDIPLSLSMDIASVESDSGLSYRLCAQRRAGKPVKYGDLEDVEVPATLLPGVSMKSALSWKRNIDLWRSKGYKAKLAQPYDLFICHPHVSASAIIGGVVTACMPDNLAQLLPLKSRMKADLFSTISFTAQYGRFQRLFLDLTRLNARLDFPSGVKFLGGAKSLAHCFKNSQRPGRSALQSVVPGMTVSFQQQIAGPFSFRVDSGITVDLEAKDRNLHFHDQVFAIEYALQVLGSAKAVAWFSPKLKEFMVELRFFES